MMGDSNSKTKGIVPFRFKPGQSGNPGGSTKGARRKVSAAFISALAEDFEKHGVATIKKVRETDPVSYVRIVASMIPRQVEQVSALDDVSDEELAAMLEWLRRQITPGPDPEAHH